MRENRFLDNLSPKDKEVLHNTLLKRVLDADTSEPETFTQIIRDEISKRFPQLNNAIEKIKKINLNFPPEIIIAGKNIIPELIRVQIRKIVGDK